MKTTEKRIHGKRLLAWALVASAIIWPVFGCSDDDSANVDADAGADAGTDAGEVGTATQFCWAQQSLVVIGRFMAPFSDGSFVATGKLFGLNNENSISRFGPDGTVWWQYAAEGNIAWMDTSPSDGITAVLEVVPETSAGPRPSFFTLIDEWGSQLWSRQIADDSVVGTVDSETWETTFPQIAANAAPDGSFVVAAAFNGELVLDEGEADETIFDSGGAEVLAAYVARFDTAGSLVAARQLSTPLLPVALAVTPTGEIAIAGFEDNPLPGISLTKLTADGDELWSEHAVTQTNSWPPPLNLNADSWEEGPQSSIRLVSGEDGALVLAGNFEGDIVVGDGADTSVPLFSPWELFDDGTAVATAPSHFLAGFTADGVLEWARAGEFTGEFTEEDAYSGYNMAASQQLTLAAQANGDILIVGAVLGSLVSGNADGTTTALDDGYFTAKYDAANGDQIEVIPFDVGSNGSYVEFQSAAELPDGTAVIAARYSGALAFTLGDGTEFDADGPYSFDGAFLLLKTCADGE